MIPELDIAKEMILTRHAELESRRAVLAGITGIDGSGKGFISDRLTSALMREGIRVASISVDGWLNLPHVRFAHENPAEHFYLHAIRFDDLFGQLVLPLKEQRSHCLEADVTQETATVYQKRTYRFQEIEVIVLEGIFLLKRAYQNLFDLSFWVECSFETALERAIQRGQEGLPPEDTERAYHTIYFPAQRIHLGRDHPRSAASAIIANDPRIPDMQATCT